MVIVWRVKGKIIIIIIIVIINLFEELGGAGEVMSIIVYHCKPGEIGEILA